MNTRFCKSCQHLLENIIPFNLKREKKTLLWSSNRCLKMKYIFSRFLLITPREMLSYSVITTIDSWYKQNWNYKSEAKQEEFLSVFLPFWFLTLTDRCKKKKKNWAHCQRQSFLLSDWFPPMLNQWRTKITSISTKRTYQSINAPVASFLAKSQPVSKLEKNCRKSRITCYQ